MIRSNDSYKLYGYPALALLYLIPPLFSTKEVVEPIEIRDSTEDVVLIPLVNCRIAAPVFLIVISDVSSESVPTPILVALKILETVATPTVRSSISTSASDVKDAAVLAVPVTLPVIPPIKLEAATADAVRIPTITSGDPTNPSAPVAIPVTLPVTSPVKLPIISPMNPEDAVIVPPTEISLGNLEFNRTGNLSLEIVPDSIFVAFNNVNSDPIPVYESAVTIPVAKMSPLE